jgi:hypothetical protein
MIPGIFEKIIRKYWHFLYRISYRYDINPYKNIGGVEVVRFSKFFYDADSKKDIIEIYNRHFYDNFYSELESAENSCDHRFDFLGHTVRHGTEIQWMLDPASHKNWDNRFSFDIVYKGSGRLGDVKYPWELSKHQYFFTLGKLYWLTGNAKFRDEIIGQIDSWIEKNPICSGINWISALEIGMRVISWIMVYPFIVERLDKNFLSRFTNSLFFQLEFIAQNLSRSKFANTHLIGEAASLIMGGLFLKSPKSKRWIAKGLNILKDEIQDQVFPDGVDKEQSLNYQRFFLDYYYLTIILLKKNGLKYPIIIDNKIEKMTEFILYALKPDGSAPSFGDTDDSRGIYVKKDCIYDYRGILSLGAVLFNRGDFKYAAGSLTEEILWLVGKDGVENYLNIEPVPPRNTSIAFKTGGYYIMRSRWDITAKYLVFDCGSLGHGPAGHGHADALSFQLYSDGFNYLIDPGTYSYNIDYEWRDYFRSTPAHNTITVDGLNQSEIKDRMSWKTSANSRCNLWLSTGWFDLVDGEHDGYKRLDDPVSHRRVIFSDKNNYWVIIDLLKSHGKHTFDYHLHLHPDCLPKVDYSKKNIDITSPENGKIRVQLIEEGREGDGSEFEVFKGDEETRLGWFSENYGSKKATNTVRVRKESEGGARFISFIYSTVGDYEMNVEQPLDDKLWFSISNPEGKDTFFYALYSPSDVKSDAVFFKGRLFYIKENYGKSFFIYAKDFMSFEIGKDIAISSDEKIESLTVSKKEYEIAIPEENIKNLKISATDLKKLVINGKRYALKNGRPSPTEVT